MRIRVALALLACACLLAQQAFTVEQLVAFVTSSIKAKMPDKEVAAFLAKVTLSERLASQTVEELQREGAGPKTITALNTLAAASESYPNPPKQSRPQYTQSPPPTPIEQQTVIGEIREYAMNYSKKLPDFICTQVTRKYVTPVGKDDFHLESTVVEHLTYFEQREHYNVMMVNDKMVDLAHDAVSGAGSSGDFGSMLKVTLWPRADATIDFEQWHTLRGHECYGFSYSIASGNSDYSILWGKSERKIVGYRGLIYVDKKTHEILRLTLEATGIPADFPVQEASEILDYDYQNLSGPEFLLPLRAQVLMRHERERSRNDIDFRMYKKYSADTKIEFETDVAAPLPQGQSAEQQVEPQQAPK